MSLRSWLVILAFACGCNGPKAPVDDDGDGFAVEDDCDDGDAETNPAATEVCDGKDNNCDDAVDEGLTVTV
jgi:hypothetical protein